MPRYRFSWDVVPQPLLRRLARELDLPGQAAEALAGAYGKRPRETFVRDAWPVLRDGWLARDTPTRREVVGALRERGLGNLELPVRTRAQQQAYLATCRNSPSLRRIVLPAFHALGEQPGFLCGESAVSEAAIQELAKRSASGPRRLPRPPREFRGLDGGEIFGPWTEFEDRYAAALEQWGGGPMEVGLPEFHRRDSDTWVRPWIRISDDGEGAPELTIESGSPFAMPVMVGPEYDEKLRRYGWFTRPANEDDVARVDADPDDEWCYRAPVPTGSDGCPDHFAAARLVTDTCMHVFGVLHPSFLEPEGFWEDKDTEFERVENGDRVPPPHEGYSAEPADRAVVYDINDTDHLQELVDIAIAQRLGGPVTHDGDGDIPVNINGVTAYIRVRPDAPMVTAFCWLLVGVPDKGKVFRRLNELNQRYRVAKLTYTDGAVMATVELVCCPFVPALVRDAIDGLAAVIGDINHLADRLGGRRFGTD